MGIQRTSAQRIAVTLSFLGACLLMRSGLAQPNAQDRAQRALARVVDFYRAQVGFEGAYLWRYSADLLHQQGEEVASATSGWTQPPGTPTVGESYLRAWRYSGNTACRDAAIEAARALVRAQLQSGGWDSHFDLGPEGTERYAYRQGGNPNGRNLTTFDDNKSQSALSLLMHVDAALDFKDAEIHEAVEYALRHMLAAQYPNGAWPQQYAAPVDDPAAYPVQKASYPGDWPRTFPGNKYHQFYTLNDNNMSRIIDMMLEAHRIYDRADCYQSALKTGDFFILAQLPDPQPGWAQQYSIQMQPAWARKFEPPSITGGESQEVMRSLLQLYEYTGDKRFLTPLPTAIAYYRASLLSDGRLARFYELQTNRPLYFTKDYELTYSDADVPTHYAFEVSAKLDAIEKEYSRLAQVGGEQRSTQPKTIKPLPLNERLEQRGLQVIEELDERGAWIEEGSMKHSTQTLPVIDMKTFVQNLELLAQLAGATSSNPE